MGCHASEADAQQQIAAIHASEGASVSETVDFAVATTAMTGGDGYESMSDVSGTPWTGILLVEGMETGDGREFQPYSVTWVDPQEAVVPLRRNIEDSHGGTPMTKTVLVGRIDQIWRNPDNPLEIWGSGVFDDQGEQGAEAVRLVRDRFMRGISVDPDSIKDADIELVYNEDQRDDEGDLMGFFTKPEKTVFHAGRLRAATLVDIPAFVEAQIWLNDDQTDGGMMDPAMAAETEAFHLPGKHNQKDHGNSGAPTVHNGPADRHGGYDKKSGRYRKPSGNGFYPKGWKPTSTAAAELSHHFDVLSDRPWSGPNEEQRLRGHVTVQSIGQAFAHVVPGGDGGTTAGRFFHHHVDDDGNVREANMTAVAASLRSINAGRAGNLTEAQRFAAYEHLAAHLRSAGLVAPEYVSSEVLTAAGVLEDERPPREWFDDPKLTSLTPLTVTDEGRVYGHGAAWGTCHTGYAGECRQPPEEGEHVYYRLGEVVCADGSRVAVGHITLGTGHAGVRGFTPSRAVEHYDNTGTVVALVASGEDAHGIWIAGSIKPGTPMSRVDELRASSLSGDWRRIGGQLRLVAFLAVNRPGFPIPRLSAFVSQGKQLSLVAAGIVSPDVRERSATRAAVERIAKSIGRDRASRLAEVRARVGR